MKTLRGMCIAAFALIALHAIQAFGQDQHPNMERGFSAEKVYDFANVDTIGLFDGSLKATIPIGPEFHVNAGLAYSLKLVYNSQLWDLHPGTITIWPEGQPAPIEVEYVDSWPSRRSNAGVGWFLSFGKIFDSGTAFNTKSEWIYESWDGHDHEMGDLDTIGNVDYSHDGTYIRATRTGTTEVKLEFPDGTIQYFDRYSTDDWRLRSIQDRFNNRMWIEYSSNGDTWTIKDDHTGRTQTIYFIDKSIYNAYGNRLVDRVVLAGYGDNTTREYKFNYQDATFDNSCEYRDGSGHSSSSYTQPFLTSINLPDGSTWQMKYSNSIGTAKTNCDQGALTSLKLPTRGTLRWNYILYSLPTSACNGQFMRMANVIPGVGTRTMLDDSLADGGRITTYSPAKGPDLVPACSHSPVEWVSNTVRMPDGGRTIYYFNAYDVVNTTSPNGCKSWERGLPYRKLSDGRKLSSEFLGDCTGANCPALRSAYVNWEYEVKSNEQRSHRNGREQYRKVVYNDDGGLYTDKSASRYDGAGHFRTTVASSNIGGLTRFETTEYDGTAGDMTVDASGHILTDVTRPAPSQPWLLNTYSRKSATEGNTTVTSTFCFDKTTGFLLRERLDDGGPHDLLTVYSQNLANGDAAQNNKGNVLSEEYYGGDDQTLDAAQTVCNTPLPSGGPRYTIFHQYDFGTRKSSAYKDASFKLLDLTIDRNTGLASESRDLSGVLTKFDYDELDRLKEVATTGRAKTQYLVDTTAYPPQVTIQALDPVTSAVLTDSHVYYDAFGRVAQTREKMPDGWATSNMTYDAKGRKQSVSSAEYRTGAAYEGSSVFTPAHVSSWVYDVYDRVSSEFRPDNTFTTYSYTGDRERVTYRQLATAFDQPDTAVTTTEDFDFQKRLIKVIEKSGPPNQVWPLGTEVTTNYVYDIGDRLVAVKMSAPDGVMQNRIFDYDGRGLLRWESHPEAGMTAYSYDARGHLLTKRIGAANTYFDLNYQYDSAERLVRVEGRDPQNPAQFQVLKEFEFGDANNGGDLRQGKLVRSARYNYRPQTYASFPWQTVRVTETFGYNDTAGQKTDRTTTIATSYDNTNWQEARGISQSVSYDILGHPSQVKYPVCVNCGTPPGNPWREITSSYSNGRLTGLLEPPSPGSPPSIPSFVSNISYAANGMRTAINHTNSIIDTRTPDPSGMTRPSVVKSETYKPCHAPLITSQTIGVVRTTTQGSVRLQVSATGSDPLSYAWYDSTVNPPTLIASGTSYVDVSPTSTHTYFAEVTNDCRTLRSATITVKYGDCIDAWIASETAVRNANGTYTLSVTAFGTGNLNYTWQSVPDNAVIGMTQTVTTGVLTATTFAQYRITVTNGCGGPGDSKIVYVSVPISVAPMTIDAHRNGTTNQIVVSWSAVSGATSYDLERRDSTGYWNSITTGNFAQYTDVNLPLNTAYAYRVTARDQYNDTIGQSPADIASTFTFTDVSAGMGVSAGPLNELLQALNGVRALSGWAAVSWSNILSPDDVLPDPGSIVIARHVLALRTRLNEAVQSIGGVANGYSDSDVQGLSIKAAHITELQNRLR